MISLQHAENKHTDGKSHLATMSHTLCTYLCIKPEETWPRSGLGKGYTDKTIQTAKRVIYARTYNLAWWQTIRRRRGGEAALYYDCLNYQPMSDDTYVHKQQTSRGPRVEAPVNSI